jgi:hypothetical protein
LFLVTEGLVNQKLADIFPLISLKLDDVSALRVVHNTSVATEVLLDFLQNGLEIKFFVQTLDSRDTLTTIALLHTDVDVATCLATLGVGDIIRKRISDLEVDKIGHTTEKEYLLKERNAKYIMWSETIGPSKFHLWRFLAAGFHSNSKYKIKLNAQ